MLLNDKRPENIARPLRVTYAKNERNIKGNADAAMSRIERRHKKSKGQKKSIAVVVEGNRASKDKSGGSGFKMSKKRGKMRLLEK